MAYANSHVKVTIFGTSMNGGEEWSTGFRMGSEDPAGGNFDVDHAWVDSLLPAWATFFSGVAGQIHGNWKTTGIKASVIMPDGKTDLSSVYTSSYGSPISGYQNSALFPPQIALVAQLAAASPVGLGSKGRMYLPGVVALLGGDGHIAEAARIAMANALAVFLTDAVEGGNSPGVVINCSKGRVGIPYAAPVNREVTHVRIGSVYDTQRRRRNGLTEQYSQAAL